MAGPIFCNMFMSKQLLLSYVDLKILMNRNLDEFCLMASDADADYRMKLTEVYLKIRKVKVNPSISLAHELALKKGPAIYPVRCVECKSFIIPAGNPSLRKDKRLSLEWSIAQHSTVPTRRIPSTFRILQQPS